MKISKVDYGLLFWVFNLFLFYIMDAFDKYSRSVGDIRIAYILRAVSLVLMLLYIFYHSKKIFNSKDMILNFSLLVFIFLGYIFNGIYVNQNIFDSIYILIRYLSVIVYLYFSLAVLYNSNKYTRSNFILLSGSFVFIFSFNSIISILGFIFEWEITKTYGYFYNDISGYYDSRFGFNGLMIEQNISTFFYTIGFIISYWLYKEKRINFLLLIFLLSSCLLVGTKSLYLMVLLTLIFLNIKSIYFRFVGIVITIIIILSYISQLSDISSVFSLSNFDILLSGRLGIFYTKVYPLITNLTITQFLFGFQGGDASRFLSEMEFIDIFIFFGLLGGISYLLIIFNLVNRNIDYSDYDSYKSVIILIITVSFFSGHLFYDPSSAYYFCTLILIIKLRSKYINLKNRGYLNDS